MAPRKPKTEKTVKVESVTGSLKDLKSLKMEPEAPAAPVTATVGKKTDAPRERIQRLDSKGRSYGTGRRKDAVARVWLKPGKGMVIVNGRDQSVYFARQTQRLVLNQPFLIANRVGQFDVWCTVTGGGLSGQAGAVRHGIARALENYEPDLRPSLKKGGMLTRDSRVVERKKVGLHKARRSKQWAKR